MKWRTIGANTARFIHEDGSLYDTCQQFEQLSRKATTDVVKC